MPMYVHHKSCIETFILRLFKINSPNGTNQRSIIHNMDKYNQQHSLNTMLYGTKKERTMPVINMDDQNMLFSEGSQKQNGT